MPLSSAIRAAVGILLVVSLLSGCGLLFVNGPAPSWQDASVENLPIMAASAPCSTGKVPIIGDLIIGGFGVGLVMAELYNRTQHDGYWGESEKATEVFGAVLAAPYPLSAHKGNQKVNDCRAFNVRLSEER